MDTDTDTRNAAESGGKRRESLDTTAARGASRFEPATGAISTPIYQSSAFRHPALFQSTGFDYSRAVNPTRTELERTVALLESGKYGLAFATGMGALSALIKLYAPGDHIIVSEDLYGGTYRLFTEYYEQYGFSFSWVDTSDTAAIKESLRRHTKALFIETPSNPMMKVSDIEACADLIHRHSPGAGLIVDNTFLSPYFQNPLALGADVVTHSGTKYLSGHNDTLSGFIVHSRDDLEDPLRNIQKSEGASLSPFDAWLTLRGIKTLALRMRRCEENALHIASWLRAQPLVERVFFPGFPDHPQYALSRAQSRGFGGMISFYVKDRAAVPVILKSVSLILFAESLGGVESLITYPLEQTHTAIPETMRLKAGVNDRLLRLSVGIEDKHDLVADLDAAFRRWDPR
ncbi:MAG: PLP-dependent aspartate aminotransferase family protein [Spirochaetaceae bacterium]|jgi:cystathionine gamma-synthase|nr:PLP-dependent aspartate aminotransferase family protein [Spirochaetaceae bacterium]